MKKQVSMPPMLLTIINIIFNILKILNQIRTGTWVLERASVRLTTKEKILF